MRAVDDRAVSEVIGAVLVFALVLMLVVLVQTLAVPAANGQIEFEHNQRVQGDFQRLEGSVDAVAQTGTEGSVSVETGVRYPSRFFLLNPAPAAGTLETRESAFGIGNAAAVDGETRDFWDGGETSYESRALVYRPDYNEYASAPTTVYESGVVSRQFDDTTLLDSGNGVVNDRRITLVALDGDRSTTDPGSVMVEARPVSAPAQSVSVRNAAPGEPVTVRLQSDLSESAWERLLANERTGSGGHVTDVSCANPDPCGTVTISLEPDVTYDLRMAKVSVGSGATAEDAAYLTTVGGAPTLSESGLADLTVEARDRFNVGEGGVPVTVTLAEGDGYFVDDQGNPVGETHTVTTAADGRATVGFRSTGTTPARVEATSDLDGDGDSDAPTEIVTFAGLERSTATDDSDSEINPNDDDSVTLQSATIRNAGTQQNKRWVVDVTFRNHATEQKEIAATRLNFYNPSALGGRSGTDSIERGVINGTNHTIAGQYVTSWGPDFDETIPATETQTYEFELQYRVTTGQDRGELKNFQVLEGDFFVYSVRYADGTTSRYFISPRDPST